MTQLNLSTLSLKLLYLTQVAGYKFYQFYVIPILYKIALQIIAPPPLGVGVWAGLIKGIFKENWYQSPILLSP